MEHGKWPNLQYSDGLLVPIPISSMDNSAGKNNACNNNLLNRDLVFNAVGRYFRGGGVVGGGNNLKEPVADNDRYSTINNSIIYKDGRNLSRDGKETLSQKSLDLIRDQVASIMSD